jgi:HSP20 family protein
MAAWEGQHEVSPLQTFTPTFEVHETQAGFAIRADLPGVGENDLQLSVSGRELTISGTREADPLDEGDNLFLDERTFGRFRHTFTLPDDVDPAHIRAELRDGVLTLYLPLS